MPTAARERTGIMLCYEYTEKRLLKYPKPWLVQPKLEGDRCRAVWNGESNEWDLVSSTGMPRNMVPHIRRELFEQPWSPDFQELDGELYKHGMRHEDIRSIVSRTVDIHPDYSDIEYHIFDYPTNLCNYERNHYLQRLSGSEKIKIVKTKLCSTLLEVEEAYREFLDHGYEGIVIRNPKGLYKRSRSTDLMKLKPRQELEALVEGVFQQKNKNGQLKNALGGVECYHSGSQRRFEVGTGFTKEERERFWANPELVIGKLIEVEFQDWTETSIKMQSFKRIVGDYTYE